MKVNIKSLTIQEMISLFEEMGYKKFRAKQVYGWLHKHQSTRFKEMKNIPKDMIEYLETKYYIDELKEIECLTDGKDHTQKYLLELRDGHYVETVVMSYKYGISICISSQVGCKMGCDFCASTKNGFIRNLDASEMLEQIYYIERKQERKVHSVVVMGTGEPLDNYEQLSKFIQILNSSEGRNLGARNITVSTCGILPRIMDMAYDFPQVNLAISLHASNQVTRESIMPIAKQYHIYELIDTCKAYCNITNRRITFEYALIAGKNDRHQHVVELSSLLKPLLCHINLIPINPIKESAMSATKMVASKEFKRQLELYGLNVTIRRALGQDIDAACGQLRNRYIES